MASFFMCCHIIVIKTQKDCAVTTYCNFFTIGRSIMSTITGTSARDTLNGTSGNDTIYAQGGNDLVYGNGGDDYIGGGAGSDVLNGDGGSDSIFGGAGDDRVNGGNQSDLLFGGDGRDRIDGGSGNDTILGGAGRDNLVGGSGSDRFEFYDSHGNDTIPDFSFSQGDSIILGGSINSYSLSPGQTFTGPDGIPGTTDDFSFDVVIDTGQGSILLEIGYYSTVTFPLLADQLSQSIDFV